MKKKIKI